MRGPAYVAALNENAAIMSESVEVRSESHTGTDPNMMAEIGMLLSTGRGSPKPKGMWNCADDVAVVRSKVPNLFATSKESSSSRSSFRCGKSTRSFAIRAWISDAIAARCSGWSGGVTELETMGALGRGGSLLKG